MVWLWQWPGRECTLRRWHWVHRAQGQRRRTGRRDVPHTSPSSSWAGSPCQASCSNGGSKRIFTNHRRCTFRFFTEHNITVWQHCWSKMPLGVEAAASLLPKYDVHVTQPWLGGRIPHVTCARQHLLQHCPAFVALCRPSLKITFLSVSLLLRSEAGRAPSWLGRARFSLGIAGTWRYFCKYLCLHRWQRPGKSPRQK